MSQHRKESYEASYPYHAVMARPRNRGEMLHYKECLYLLASGGVEVRVLVVGVLVRTNSTWEHFVEPTMTT